MIVITLLEVKLDDTELVDNLISIHIFFPFLHHNQIIEVQVFFLCPDGPVKWTVACV